MPLVLVPIVGAEPVVPILAISALMNNASRALAFRRSIDLRRARIALIAALPTCVVGAYIYTRLTSFGALIVIGTMLALSVPLRRMLFRRNFRLGDRGFATSTLAYGLFAGGTTGAGVILLSLLMAAGLEGAAVIATDALISIAIGVVKTSVFGLAGAVTGQVVAIALIMGLVALPGAFLAKAFVAAMPAWFHTVILDAMVLLGGATMIIGAFTLR